MISIPDIKDIHEQVIDAYVRQGFSIDVVNGWAVSENDIFDFLAPALESQPKNILEVGTFVGVSTMLLALVCPKAIIHTVDPDFPLSVEVLASDYDAVIEKSAPTHHEIARLVAKDLGLSDRIVFHKGGFAVGDTFSSLFDPEGSKTEVIGPKLCEEHGPFDYIFIDGLHTSEAVTKDLELAQHYLEPGSTIVLHDCIGYWGVSVRAGVFEFLRQNPGYNFLHPRYQDLYKSVGIVKLRDKFEASDFRQPSGDWLDIPGVQNFLKTTARTILGAEPFVEITYGKTSFGSTSKRGNIETLSVAYDANTDILGKNFKTIRPDTIKGLFSAEFLDFATSEQVDSLFNWLSEHELVAVLGATPPGEIGVAGPNSRSLPEIVNLAQRHGLNLFCLPAIDLEPMRFPLLPKPRYLGLTSLMLSVVIISAQDEYVDALGRVYSPLSYSMAIDREQSELQRVHVAVSFRHYYTSVDEVQKKYVSEHDNRKVDVQNLKAQLDDVQQKYIVEHETRISEAQTMQAKLNEERDLRLRLAEDGLNAQFKARIDHIETLVNEKFDGIFKQVENNRLEADGQRRKLFEDLAHLNSTITVIEDFIKAQMLERITSIEAKFDGAKEQMTEQYNLYTQGADAQRLKLFEDLAVLSHTLGDVRTQFAAKLESVQTEHNQRHISLEKALAQNSTDLELRLSKEVSRSSQTDSEIQETLAHLQQALGQSDLKLQSKIDSVKAQLHEDITVESHWRKNDFDNLSEQVKALSELQLDEKKTSLAQFDKIEQDKAVLQEKHRNLVDQFNLLSSNISEVNSALDKQMAELTRTHEQITTTDNSVKGLHDAIPVRTLSPIRWGEKLGVSVLRKLKLLSNQN